MAEPSGVKARPKDAPPPAAADAADGMQIDGSEVDAMLSNSVCLTRLEVLKRRAWRMRQLETIYKEHYWALMEDAKQKHRNFVWEYGTSPFEGQAENRDDANPSAEENNNNGKSGNNSNQCEIHGCKVKAMALTKYCHTHILSDPNQKLYKGCSYVLKRFGC